MHVIIGAFIVAGSFLWASQYFSMDFDGFVSIYALILLLGVPLGLTVLTYRFSTLWMALKGLFGALFERPESERERLASHLISFGRALRQGRAQEASQVIDAESDPVFKTLARHVLERGDVEEIEADAVVCGRRQLQSFRRAERVLSSLGTFAPAMGMIGTVIGLIQLLSQMHDFDKLGSGMAIALLTTLYGLMLAHLLYLPLARLVADHGAQRAENINMVLDGMLKLARRRPLYELQEVVAREPSAESGNV
ncbi:MAG: motility protein A [Persicimonas sp.]